MSKYARSSAVARRNSANSPWRRQAHCATKRAHAMRAELNRLDAEQRAKKGLGD